MSRTGDRLRPSGMTASISPQTGPTPAPAGRAAWIGLAVLALPTLLLSLDMSVLYLALPALTTDLRAGPVQQLWIMDVYGFLIAGFLVPMGALGDRIGRRRLLLTGAAAFAVASVAAAFAPTPEMLIAARAVLGVAGATLMPSTLALIRALFPDEHRRAIAISVWMCCFMGGMTVGPLVGGLLLSTFWWGSVFLLGVPVMLVLLVAGPVFLPEERDRAGGRIDLPSVALLLATVIPTIYGLKEIAATGAHVDGVAAIVAGLVVGVAFVRRQRRAAAPLVDPALFRRPAFGIALGLQLAGAIVMSGTFLLVTLYLQLVGELSPLEAGLCLVPLNLAMAAATMLTPQLAKRLRPAAVMALGFGIGAVGLVVTATAGSVLVLVAGFAVAGVGVALPAATATGLVIGSAPPEKAGAAAGVSETSGEFGIALGVAVLGSIGAAVYRGQLSVPAGVPADAAALAREGVTSAMALADRFPALVDATQAAFASGLHVVAMVGAVVFAAAALVSRTLR